MTDPQVPEDESVPPDSDPGKPDPMAALLKRSLAGTKTTDGPSILPSVQRRIRKRSRGKFFADGWSTTDARVSHALIAFAMLLILVLAYFALGPIGIQ
jgi:hypothetical protein